MPKEPYYLIRFIARILYKRLISVITLFSILRKISHNIILDLKIMIKPLSI